MREPDPTVSTAREGGSFELVKSTAECSTLRQESKAGRKGQALHEKEIVRIQVTGVIAGEWESLPSEEESSLV